MTFACLQHLDMIELRLGFGELTLLLQLLQKQYCKIKANKAYMLKKIHLNLLDGFPCVISDAAPPRMILTSKYHFTAVIIIFRLKLKAFLLLLKI